MGARLPEGAATPGPGRACPAHYGYSAAVFDRAPDLEADTLLIAGGLYGNAEALRALEALAAQERRPATIVFNGDFHWFDIDAQLFAAIESGTASHTRLRGNVETEIAGEDAEAGCGCAYPDHVEEAVVERSNVILATLRETARSMPAARAALARLPAHCVARVGDARVGIVHGDAESLAGWRFDAVALDDPAQASWREEAFLRANVDIFASSHTCRPALRCFRVGSRDVAVANNGAAGMPNFAGERHGLVTRIGTEPSPAALYRVRVRGVFVEALPLAYDTAAFEARFLAQWPPGSPAHASYWQRIAHGTTFAVADAAPGGA